MIVPPDSCNYRHSLPSLHSGGEQSWHQEQLFQSCLPAPGTHGQGSGRVPGKNGGWGVTPSKKGLGINAGWNESSSPPHQGFIQKLYRDKQQVQALTGVKPSWWPQKSPRWGAHEGRITAGHSFPTPRSRSPACEMFGAFQAGQHCSASSHGGQRAAREFGSWAPEGCRETCLGRWREK